MKMVSIETKEGISKAQPEKIKKAYNEICVLYLQVTINVAVKNKFFENSKVLGSAIGNFLKKLPKNK